MSKLLFHSSKNPTLNIPQSLFTEHSCDAMVKPLTEEQPEVCGTRILSLADAIITQTVIPASFRGTTGKPTETKISPCKGEMCMPTRPIMKYIMGYTATDSPLWRQMQSPCLQRSLLTSTQSCRLHFCTTLWVWFQSLLLTGPPVSWPIAFGH